MNINNTILLCNSFGKIMKNTELCNSNGTIRINNILSMVCAEVNSYVSGILFMIYKTNSIWHELCGCANINLNKPSQNKRLARRKTNC